MSNMYANLVFYYRRITMGLIFFINFNKIYWIVPVYLKSLIFKILARIISHFIPNLLSTMSKNFRIFQFI